MPTRTALWLVVSLLLASAALRSPGLSRTEPLHPDEALFASRARQMVLGGDFFLYNTTTDKPPTTYLLVGGSLTLLGEHDFAARLPNFYFSLLLLAELFAFIRRVAGWPAALLGLGLAVVAPLEARYAPSVFQDTPMLAALVLALGQAAAGRWGWAGWWLGLSAALKPTALWAAPLVVLIALIQTVTSTRNYSFRQALQHLTSWLVMLSLPLLAVFLWDWGRPQPFFQAGYASNQPRRFIRADEVWPRAGQWLGHLADLFSLPALGLALLALVAAGLIYDLLPRPTSDNARRRLLRWGLVAFSLAYLSLHWLLAFNTYDRYLLLVGPPLWALAGLSISDLLRSMPRPTRQRLLALVLVGLLALGLYPARQGGQPERAAAYQGIREISATLNQDYAGRIVYDYWLGWELDWYLGEQTTVQVVYFESPEVLADHLVGEKGERFFIAPSAALAEPWRALLAARGVNSEVVYQVVGSDLVLYRILPPAE